MTTDAAPVDSGGDPRPRVTVSDTGEIMRDGIAIGTLWPGSIKYGGAIADVRAALAVPERQPDEGCDDYNGVAYRDREELLDLIVDLADDDPCRLDHHGYCQTHGWLEEGECPHARAAALRSSAAAGEADPPGDPETTGVGDA